MNFHTEALKNAKKALDELSMMAVLPPAVRSALSLIDAELSSAQPLWLMVPRDHVLVCNIISCERWWYLRGPYGDLSWTRNLHEAYLAGEDYLRHIALRVGLHPEDFQIIPVSAAKN